MNLRADKPEDEDKFADLNNVNRKRVQGAVQIDVSTLQRTVDVLHVTKGTSVVACSIGIALPCRHVELA